jgi:CHAT domain-containing protein
VLRPGEIFLDAYLGPTESILFVVTATTARAVPWPPEPPLAERLRLYRDLLATPPRPAGGDRALEAVTEAGRRLRDDLLGPAADLLKTSRRVILAPDGALNLIPLADPEAKAVWMRVPSATILGFLRSEAATTRTPGHGMLAAAATTTPDGQPLPGAVREVQLLADEYLEVDRRLTALKPTDLLPFAILHLATHARIDDQRPWSSEIVLAPDGPGHRIRADRIAALDLSADLAVLSACETGSGRILSGEGVLGLSSAFLSAGVPTVVASLWPVSDRVTVDLMKEFYARLADGRDVATSLAAAQMAIRDDEATAHPFHWAGFVTVGEGAATVELEPRRRSRLPVLILVGVVLAALLLLRRS